MGSTPPSEVRIGALFPMVLTASRNHDIDAAGVLRFTAFLLALHEINDKTDGVADELLPSTTLVYALRDSRRDELQTLVGSLALEGTCAVGGQQSAKVAAVIGAASSGPSAAAAQVFGEALIPQISYSSTSADLSSGTTYPYFLRTPPSDSFQAEAIADILTQLYGYRRIAMVSSNDKYGTALQEAFFEQARQRNFTLLTSQSFTPGARDFGVVLTELEKAKARIIVLFCGHADAGRFLRVAYQQGIGGNGYLFFGSDAVATSPSWMADDELTNDLELRENVMRGFLGLVPSYGQGTTRYDGFLQRLRAMPSTLRNATSGECADGADADGIRVWQQHVSDAAAANGTRRVCVGSDNQEENSYAPFAYDATYAVAYALHHLIETNGVSAIDGQQLRQALLTNVAFQGVTGTVQFSEVPEFLGDRRVGVAYTMLNYQSNNAANALTIVGEWTPCGAQAANCDINQRWTASAGTGMIFSTGNSTPPSDTPPIPVNLIWCSLDQHTHYSNASVCEAVVCTSTMDVNSTEDDRTCSYGPSHENATAVLGRLVHFGTSSEAPNCMPRGPYRAPCAHVPRIGGEAIAGYAVVFVGCCIKAYLLYQLLRQRTKTNVKRRQPTLGVVIIVGAILLDLSMLLLPGEPTLAFCVVRPAAPVVAFVFFFSPLIFKSLRVWLLMGASMTQRMARRGQSAWRRRVPNYGSALAVFLLNGALIAAYFATISAEPVLESRRYLVTYRLHGREEGYLLPLQDAVCPNGALFGRVAYGLQALLVTATLVLAWKCRKVFTEFNESTPILFTAILAIIAGSVIAMLCDALGVFAPKNGAELGVSFVVAVNVVVGTTSLIVLILFGGQLLEICGGGEAPISYDQWLSELRGNVNHVVQGIFRRTSKNEDDRPSAGARDTSCSMRGSECCSRHSAMAVAAASARQSSSAAGAAGAGASPSGVRLSGRFGGRIVSKMRSSNSRSFTSSEGSSVGSSRSSMASRPSGAAGPAAAVMPSAAPPLSPETPDPDTAGDGGMARVLGRVSLRKASSGGRGPGVTRIVVESQSAALPDVPE